MLQRLAGENDSVQQPSIRCSVARSRPPGWLEGLRRLDWRANSAFFWYLLVSCLALSAVAAWPTLCDWLGATLDLDLRSFFGSASRKAPGRTTVGKVFSGWLVLTMGYYGLCLAERHYRGLRTFALAVALAFNATLLLVNDQITAAQRVIREVDAGNYYERQIPALKRLKIVEYPFVDLASFKSRGELKTVDIQSFGEWHRHVMNVYYQQKRHLVAQWGIRDERTLKALFFMNFVAGVWAFGNKSEPDKPGGVLFNEDVNWEPQPATLRSYLDSNIGCCLDMAYLAKCFLDHEGIENRLTEIPGHIFNEVKLGERWCILDATTNFYLETSWEELYTASEPEHHTVAVHVFPHPGLASENAPWYRPRTGHSRLLTFVRIANRPAFFKQVKHPDLPAYFD